ncbi:LamG-like jellyroll fold domain-containing protein [Niabella sp.]|uniref:LamG-like jellyroll fold domain-containing protein n=1 Tax=Niabella sp. TaxID=1962976 RepID=UPI002617E449|nr:LamG-like jellyroll fold domain-containing protein [Niabella sp.]
MKRFYFFIFLLVMGSIAACSKYYDPPEVFETAVEKPFSKKRKVLMIVLDGASGPEVKKIAPPSIMGLTEHAKYSWEAFADAQTTDGPSWANILSGKSAATSGIIDSSFTPGLDQDSLHEKEDLPVFSNFFQRLLISGYLPKTVAITPWAGLAVNGLKFAGSAVVAAADQQVKDSAIRYLQDDKLGVIMVNFNSVNLAGLASAFSADQQAYKDAVLKVDGYIKEILDAVAKRSNYKLEDWLTIVTSNHGGEGNRYGDPTILQRKIFTIYNNSNFVKKQFIAPALTNAVNHTAIATQAVLPAASVTGMGYDIPAVGAGEFTMMVKVMRTGNFSPSGNSVLVSKVSHPYTNIKGWELMTNGANNFRICIGEGGGGTTPRYFLHSKQPLPAVNSGWVTIALVVQTKTDGKRYASVYTNGVKDSTYDMTAYPDLSSPGSPLVIGNITAATGNLPFRAIELAIWNKAVSEAYIQSYPCKNGITSTDDFYSNLIGYWPCNEALGNVYRNKSPLATGKDLVMNFTPAWSLLSATNCNTPDNFLTTNTDIAPNLFYWVNLNPLSAWGFESKEWLSKYETEFIK